MRTKEEVLRRISDINTDIRKLKEEIASLEREYVDNFCPHKVGQKAIYKRVKHKNHGTSWNPKYEIKETEELLVCVHIERFTNDFWYKFKRIKKDGTLTDNYVLDASDKVEWLDEYYTEL